MAEYRYYRLDGAGNINSAEWLQAASDEEAVRLVRERNLPFEAEVWDRKRLVAKVEAAKPD